MECFRCVDICPSNSLEIYLGISCLRLEGISALKMDKGKCNECNICNEVCPIKGIVLYGEDCSSCIVCKSNPGCIIPIADRTSFLNFTISIVRIMFSQINLLGE